VILSLTDTMGSLAIATKGQWMTGVSTDISASFVKPGGKLGDKVLIEGRVVGIGQLFYSDCFANAMGGLPSQVSPIRSAGTPWP
jgi:acyl-coenzyme A thioesterase 13